MPIFPLSCFAYTFIPKFFRINPLCVVYRFGHCFRINLLCVVPMFVMILCTFFFRNGTILCLKFCIVDWYFIIFFV